MLLDNKVMLITGAARGIGAASARLGAAAGARVVIADRRIDEAQAVADELNRVRADSALALQLDIGSEQEWQAAIETTLAAFGRLDVLVNNAGTAKWRDLDAVPEEDWRDAFEVNVMAPLRAMRAAAPPMAKRGWGRIVNVSSTAGKRPSASMPEYSVAKAAELSLSRLFSDRYASKGVLVNAICPGPVASELWMEPGGLLDQSKELAGAASREEALETAGSKRPIGRLAEVEEIAAAIVFLCSEQASYVAGAAWSVDGGTVQVII
jgi:3-oxoacyl-[acyl-carrier protein] reductase